MTASDEVEIVRTASKASRSKGSFKAKLTRQTPVEMNTKGQVLKQESKDSGIVTEMFVRPKDMPSTSSKDNSQPETGTSKSEKKSRSMQKRSQSMKIKRSQSCKVKGEKDKSFLERTHDDLEVRFFFSILYVLFFRNLANHLYAKVYETQEDMCRKRNEVRLANLQLGAVRSQVVCVVL